MSIIAKWIWYPENETYPNSFVKFRKKIILKKVLKKAEIIISADSRYKLYINGKFIKRGPAPYDPRYMYYDKFDIKNNLNIGENIIAILGYYIGISTRDYVRISDFSTTAAILCQINLIFEDNTSEIIITNKSWKVKKSLAWKSGTNNCGFSVLPMNEIFDARKFDMDWITLNYNDKNWREAFELDIPLGKPTICAIKDAVNYKDSIVKKQYKDMMSRTSFIERDIDFLIEEKVYPSKIVAEGLINWVINAEQYFDTKEKDAFIFKNQKVINIEYELEKPINVGPVGYSHSKYFIFDFLKEVYGRVFFELEASEGTIVEILVSEVLKNDFILPSDNFNLWFRYICTEGNQVFELFEPLGFRFLLIMVKKNKKTLRLLTVGVNQQSYPFIDKGKFECSDEAINSLWEIGKLTQKCVSQDTIFDNPFRERAQYSGDPQFNMLGLYYQFGEYKLARKSLIQLAQSQGPEGYFLTSWPCGDRLSRIKEAYLGYVYWKPEIIDATFSWLISLWNYYLFSGDLETLQKLCPNILKLKQSYDEIIDKDNLIFSGETWFSHFFLDHLGFKSNEEKILGGNLYYKGFLDTFYLILKELNNNELAGLIKNQSEKVKDTLIRKYWSEKRKGFFSKIENDNLEFNVLVNVYALLFETVPNGQEKAVAENIKKCITPTYPTTLMYGMVYLALSPYDEEGFIHMELKNKWANMQSIKETGTFSEFWISELDWAVRCQNVACPNYILPSVILGVKPLKAGFRIFEVKPNPGFLKWARGIVPTPLGDIYVEWEVIKNVISLKVKPPPNFKLEKEENLKFTIRKIYSNY